MKRILGLSLLLLPLVLYSQQKEGVIYPGNTYVNQSPDTLFCLPKQKLETLMEQEEIRAELIEALAGRTELCDSALQLKTTEAEYWYGKLLETDSLLENMEIRNEKQVQRRKVLTKIWFGAGVVLGWVVWGVI